MSPLASITALPVHRQGTALPRILAIHGLFGSKQNWRSTIDMLAQAINLRSDAIDLRNHGASFHSDTMDVPAMAQDVLDWHKEPVPFIPIGHSMGGKVVLHLLTSLPRPPIPMAIIIDMSPFKSVGNEPLEKSKAQIFDYAATLARIQEMRLNDRDQIHDILAQVVKDEATKHFFLASLKWNDPSTKDHLLFRFNVNCISRNLKNLMDWEPPKAEVPVPILFIAGSKSPYFPEKEWSVIKSMGLFPKAEFLSISSGHWPHVEQPKQTIDAIASFIQRHLYETDLNTLGGA